MRPLAAIVAGAALGFAAANALAIGIVATFAIWALVALAFGATSASARSALTTGALFGFPVTSVFSVLVRTGGDPIAVGTSALAAGLVGAMSCLVIAGLGYAARRGLRSRG